MSTMKDLATLLGVEMYEEFMLQEDEKDIGVFKVTNAGIGHISGQWPFNIVEGICSGRYKIVKLPWKPKQDEIYWYSDYKNDVFGCRFSADNTYDLMLYAVGNCFRTKEEAETHKHEIMNKLKSIYESGGKTK